jgi:dTDP-4-dehydrorhamnose reductase
MRIMIAGAGGLVGRELARGLSDNHQVLALKRQDLDITNNQAVRQLVDDERPSLIIDCAVLGLSACEIDQSRAWDVNVVGTENLARAAAGVDADFMYLSTNYVFDGKREDNLPYTIHDTPAPVNTYGQTKLAGERVAMSVSLRTFVVRTSWIFGVGKKNFFSTIHHSLRAGKRTQSITDVWASSTYVRDLAARVDEILKHRHYSIYHVVNRGTCSYYDFALEAARVLNLSNAATKHLIEPVKASEVPHSVRRPRFTPMRCVVSEELGLSPMRDWRASLADYIRSDESAKPTVGGFSNSSRESQRSGF